MSLFRALVLATCGILVSGLAGADPVNGPDGKRDLPQLLYRVGGEPLGDAENQKKTIAAVFSGDGKLLATCGWDQRIHLWEAATGRPLRQFEGHAGPVFSVAFSPDGRTLASGSDDQTIRLWNAATGKERLRIKGHGGGVTRVAFTPDGRFLASGSYDHSVRLWRVEDGKEVRQFEGRQKGFTTICFSSDGRYLASGIGDRATCLWETASGREIRRFVGHSGAVVGVSFSPDGYFLATASEDRNVLVWEIWSGRPCLRLRGHRNGVWAVAFSPDSRLLASAGRDRTIRLWDMNNGNALGQVEGHRQGIPMLTFSPDGRTLASASHDATAALWNMAATRPIAPASEPSLSQQELAHSWEQLALPDPANAHAAMARLSAAPRQAVPFLRGKTRPVSPEAGRHVARLIADLDSDSFRTRQNADTELEKQADHFEPVLRQLLETKPSLEVRRRVEYLLLRQSASPDLLRSLRVTRVLGSIGTPEARAILKTLAAGAPGARLTETAAQTLARPPAP